MAHEATASVSLHCKSKLEAAQYFSFSTADVCASLKVSTLAKNLYKGKNNGIKAVLYKPSSTNPKIVNIYMAICCATHKLNNTFEVNQTVHTNWQY